MDRKASSKKCSKCGQPEAAHTFVETLTCLYKGAPLQDGSTWTEKTSRLVMASIARRLGETP